MEFVRKLRNCHGFLSGKTVSPGLASLLCAGSCQSSRQPGSRQRVRPCEAMPEAMPEERKFSNERLRVNTSAASAKSRASRESSAKDIEIESEHQRHRMDSDGLASADSGLVSVGLDTQIVMIWGWNWRSLRQGLSLGMFECGIVQATFCLVMVYLALPEWWGQSCLVWIPDRISLGFESWRSLAWCFIALDLPSLAFSTLDQSCFSRRFFNEVGSTPNTQRHTKDYHSITLDEQSKGRNGNIQIASDSHTTILNLH